MSAFVNPAVLFLQLPASKRRPAQSGAQVVPHSELYGFQRGSRMRFGCPVAYQVPGETQTEHDVGRLEVLHRGSGISGDDELRQDVRLAEAARNEREQ